MMSFLRRVSLLLIVLAMAGGARASAVSAAAYAVIDAGSGRVLCGEHEQERRSIASTTKVMTALVAIEEKSLADTTTVKQKHLREGSSIYLRAGEELRMETLLYGLMLASGNDAAECIADACGGRENFLARMNAKAAALGMTNTSFANPSGLEESAHYSCALDLARLMADAMEHPTFARIVSTRTATAGERAWTNHNKLLALLPGCIGGKTGYTKKAGRTLVSCAERDGLRLVCVTLCDGDDWADHQKLLSDAFSAYTAARAVTRGETCALVRVRGGAMPAVRAVATKSFSYPLAAGETLETQFVAKEGLCAPVERGTCVGELRIFCAGKNVGTVPLSAAETVDVNR